MRSFGRWDRRRLLRQRAECGRQRCIGDIVACVDRTIDEAGDAARPVGPVPIDRAAKTRADRAENCGMSVLHNVRDEARAVQRKPRQAGQIVRANRFAHD